MADLTKMNPYISSVKLHVLGNGGLGNPCSLYIITDNKRYLFNCGEGTQRLIIEHKLNLSKLDDVFLTRTTWDKFGGLPGLSMTLKGVGTTNLRLHGPSDLVELYDMINHYGVGSALSVTQHDYTKCNFQDNIMEVQRIELSCKGAMSCDLPSQQNSIFCYICSFHDKPGELMIQKCVELNVPRGPMLAKLKSGEDVTLPDGRTIFSKDVVGQPEKGPIFFVIDCPSKLHLNELLTSDLLSEYQQKCFKDNIVNAVVHFTPSCILDSENYQEFISKFPMNTYHMYLNEKSPSLSFVATCDLQSQLNTIDNKIFPLLKYTKHEEVENIIPKQHPTGFECVLRPKSCVGFTMDSIVKFNSKEASCNVFKIEDVSKLIDEYQQLSDSLLNLQENYPEVIFLGTGSAIPSKYRNLSSILVKIDEETTIMLDCGEGTFGQMTRLFGNDIDIELGKLKAIYVSHSHADHHLGIIDVLRKREPFKLPPLPLIIPEAVKIWLNLYNQSSMKIDHLFKVYLSTSFRSPNSCLLKSLKLHNLVTVEVPHSKDSLGIIFRTNTEPSYKIVYSGDAMPCSSLIREGMDCDILIHEATMEDDLEEEAVIKQHTTISQAIEVGCKMKAKTTILTHFSQRYPKMPLLPETMKNVGIAFDNMRVRISDMDSLPLLVKPLKALFYKECKEMQERTLLISKKHLNEDEIFK